MEYYSAMEKILKDCREARLIWRTVSKLTLEEVVCELTQLQLNARGPERILRERLLRSSIRTADLPVEVPWFAEWDERDGEPPFSLAPVSEASESEARPKKKRGRKPKSAAETSEETTAEVSESIAASMPPVVITSVAITTTGSTTTSTSVCMSTGTRVVQATSMVPTPAALPEGLFQWASQSRAQLLLAPEIGNWLASVPSMEPAAAGPSRRDSAPFAEQLPRTPKVGSSDVVEKRVLTPPPWSTPGDGESERRSPAQEKAVYPPHDYKSLMKTFSEARIRTLTPKTSRGQDGVSDSASVSTAKSRSSSRRGPAAGGNQRKKCARNSRRVRRKPSPSSTSDTESESSSSDDSSGSSSESSASSDDGGRGGRRHTRTRSRSHRPRRSGPSATDALFRWGLKFSGKAKDGPEEFLVRLEECKRGARLDDRDLLEALPYAFKEDASCWYRGVQADLATWKQFKKAFRNRFVGAYSREELRDELKARTQGKNERISEYVACVRYLIGHFRHPPSLHRQLAIVYDNLLPEYRKNIKQKKVVDFASLEKLGLKYEKQKEKDSRFVPPPPREKARIAGAAYQGTRTSKIAAVRQETTTSDDEERSKKRGQQMRKKKPSGEKSSDQVAAAGEANLARAPAQPAPLRAAVAPNGAPPTSRPANARPPPKWESRESPNYGRQWRREGPPVNGFQQNVARSDRPRSPLASNGQGFVGACYTCQAVGHRAVECPRTRCFACQDEGHRARDCPKRVAREDVKCQVCGRAGAVFSECPTNNCAFLRNMLGNGVAGAQGPSSRPQAPQ